MLRAIVRGSEAVVGSHIQQARIVEGGPGSAAALSAEKSYDSEHYKS